MRQSGVQGSGGRPPWDSGSRRRQMGETEQGNRAVGEASLGVWKQEETD